MDGIDQRARLRRNCTRLNQLQIGIADMTRREGLGRLDLGLHVLVLGNTYAFVSWKAYVLSALSVHDLCMICC